MRESIKLMFDRISIKNKDIQEVLLDYPDVYKDASVLYKKLQKKIRELKNVLDIEQNRVYKKYKNDMMKIYNTKEIEEYYLNVDPEVKKYKNKIDELEEDIISLKNLFALLQNYNYFISNVRSIIK